MAPTPHPPAQPEIPRLQTHIRVDADLYRRPLTDYQLCTLARSIRMLMGGEKGEG